MLVGLLYVGTLWIVLLCVVWEGCLVVSPKNEYFLSMKISKEQRTDAKVQRLAEEYRKAKRLLHLAALVLSFLPLLFTDIGSLQVFYMTVWCTALLFGEYKIIKNFTNRMYELKVKKGWTNPDKKTVCEVDTAVSLLKKKLPVSAIWFGIPLWIGISSGFWWLLKAPLYGVLGIIVVSNLLVTGVFICMYRFAVRGRLKVYSENSEKNYALNRLVKRAWSGWIVLEATVISVMQFLTMIFLLQYLKKLEEHPGEASGMSFLIFTAVSVVVLLAVTLVLFVRTSQKLRTAKEMLLNASEKESIVDEDYYWRNGYYFNPNDSCALVENRSGLGMTANMAGVWGKVTKGALLAVLVLCLGISVALLPLDFGTVTAKTDGKTIELRGGFYYKLTIDLSDISDVVLLTECPKMSRIWGSGMKHMALGDYSFSGYGNGKAMLFKDAEYFLMVQNGKGKWNGFSVKNSEEMLRYYELLLQAKDNISN